MRVRRLVRTRAGSSPATGRRTLTPVQKCNLVVGFWASAALVLWGVRDLAGWWFE